MCYSAESSIKNYALGMLLSLGLYTLGNNYDKHFAFFIFVVIQMQLAEYFMWKDQKCGAMNKIATIAANVILVIQAFSVLFGGYLFNTLNLSNSLILNISVPYLLIGLLIIFYRYYNEKGKICTKAPNGYLVWFFYNNKFFKGVLDKLQLLLYLILLIIPWLYLKDFDIGFVIALIISGSLIIHTFYHNKENEWQSKWCYYTSNSVSIYILYRLVSEYIKNNL